MLSPSGHSQCQQAPCPAGDNPVIFALAARIDATLIALPGRAQVYLALGTPNSPSPAHALITIYLTTQDCRLAGRPAGAAAGRGAACAARRRARLAPRTDPPGAPGARPPARRPVR